MKIKDITPTSGKVDRATEVVLTLDAEMPPFAKVIWDDMAVLPKHINGPKLTLDTPFYDPKNLPDVPCEADVCVADEDGNNRSNVVKFTYTK
ncbi:hypothetical protein [Embleya sp. NPDC001921]